ncbi:heterokaryon incompatibility protein-domain-containing protein [Leptodontidium sp. 2 PMI_412]|nr:heterokaryon incompatibility protein-domain-containing protein [Leptodontidium sp. 2 PMI_412]
MAAVIRLSTITYSPLSNIDEIRLVILESGSGDDPIICQLFHVKLGDRKYEALSYEWGDASDDEQEISIGGKDVRVRRNLCDALRHIRQEDEGLCLWIDAMCIDQSTVLERNHQVGMMGKIYSQATNVIAWLGVGREDSDLAMDKLMEFDALTTRIGKDQISLSLKRYYGNELDQIPDGTVPFFIATEELNAVIAIANRSYWSRMWIIQEIQLPPHLRVHCGTRAIEPSAFLSFLELASRDDTAYGYDLKGTPAFFLLRQRHARIQSKHAPNYRSQGLQEWLSGCVAQPVSGLSPPFSSSEPRDFVYALLGVAGDCQNGELKPDYSKPLFEVYADVFRLPSSGIYKPRLENDLALKLGFIDKAQHTENERKLNRYLDSGKDPGSLLWPSGRFKLDSRDIAESAWVWIFPLVLVLLTIVLSPLILVYLFSLLCIGEA